VVCLQEESKPTLAFQNSDRVWFVENSFNNNVDVQQEDLEASAREELLREELLEEIEQRVGGLRELEEAGREEQLTK